MPLDHLDACAPGYDAELIGVDALLRFENGCEAVAERRGSDRHTGQQHQRCDHYEPALPEPAQIQSRYRGRDPDAARLAEDHGDSDENTAQDPEPKPAQPGTEEEQGWEHEHREHAFRGRGVQMAGKAREASPDIKFEKVPPEPMRLLHLLSELDESSDCRNGADSGPRQKQPAHQPQTTEQRKD